MFTPLLPLSLPGFVVEHVSTAEPLLLVEARASTPEASCPDCHTASAHVHSRSTRHLRDLPVAEHPVRLRLQVRRFRCATRTCPRQTFRPVPPGGVRRGKLRNPPPRHDYGRTPLRGRRPARAR